MPPLKPNVFQFCQGSATETVTSGLPAGVLTSTGLVAVTVVAADAVISEFSFEESIGFPASAGRALVSKRQDEIEA